MPPSLQAALVPLLVILLTAQPRKLQLDSKVLADNILAIAVAVAAAIVAGYGSLMAWLNKTGKDRAETLVPGITTKNGPVDPVVMIRNDPTAPTAPTVEVVVPANPTTPTTPKGPPS